MFTKNVETIDVNNYRPTTEKYKISSERSQKQVLETIQSSGIDWKDISGHRFDYFFDRLIISNYMCYEMNNTILELRRLGRTVVFNKEKIADLEWKVRQVGEMRVESKNEINKIFSIVYNKPKPENLNLDDIYEDDISYGIGEMLDRIIIENIKIAHFSNGLITNEENNQKIKFSSLWKERVLQHLNKKLISVQKRGYYEIAPEVRTYVLDGIKK